MKNELNKLTIRALMERAFSLYKDKPAIAYVGDIPLKYEEVSHRVFQVAQMLISHRIKKGDKVAILGENSPNWVISYFAVVSMGAVAVPILTGFPETDMRHIVRNSESVAVFVCRKHYAKIEDLKESQLHTIIFLDDFTVESSKDHTSKIINGAAHIFHKENRKSMDSIPEPEPDDLAVIIYTSGTTGHSKGVMLTHKNITADVINSIKRFPIDSNDRFLSILPLSHTFEATGGMLSPMAVGVSIYYMHGLPTPQKLIDSMQSVSPTGVLTVPLVMDKIYRKKILPQIQNKKILRSLYKTPFFRKKLNRIAGKKLVKSLGGSLRFFMFGGAALNEDVEVFLRDAHISYATGYGMTETSPIMTINPFGQVKMGSCGKSIPGIEMKIHHPDPKTKIGEIIVRGPIVMQGYYKNKDATREVFLDNEWLRTGDLGYFDEDDYLFIKGRSKNVIVGPSGENIYPEHIEQRLLMVSYIQQVVVYQSQGRLIAKAYLDYDVLDKEFAINELEEKKSESLIKDTLEDTRKKVNEELPAFSTLNQILEYPEPFEMTPTNKVKRYLYIDSPQ